MKTNIKHLIDFEKVDTLLEGFNKSTGFVTAILDLEGNVLSKSGWRQICTAFHRINPETSANCTISDTVLANKMAVGGKYHFYKCLNGLVDVAVPVVIDGEHVANLFSGQFFFEQPDKEFFLAQARKYGFDEEKYLDALGKVPVVTKESVETAMDFLLNMTQLLSEQAYQKKVLTDVSEQLRESERRLAIAIRHPAILCAQTDRNLRYTWMPHPHSDFNQQEVIGKRDDELADGEGTGQLIALKQRVLTTGQGERIEITFRLSDGQRTYDVIAEPQFDDSGQITEVSTFSLDITERKLIEEELKQTRFNYETFFNTIDDLLFVLDEQGNIIHTNSTVINRLGYTREELSGQSVLMVHPPERREEAGRIVGEMLAGTTEFCPIPIITKAGVQIPVETRVTTGFWDGKPVIFGVTKDISKLKFSEEKFYKLFHLNPSACGLSDLETHQYIEVNDAFYTLFGFDKNEVIGKTPEELNIMTDETRKMVLRNADSYGNVTNVGADLRTSNGSIKHTLLSSENIYVQDKKYRYTVVHDITDLIHAEEALKRSEAKYRTIYENASEAIILSQGSTIIDCNHKTEMLFQVKKEDIIGHNINDISPLMQPDGQSSKDKVEQILTGVKSNPQFFEWEHLRHDGTLIMTEVSLSEVEIEGVQLLQAIIQDITARKLAQKALKESELRYRTLFETSPSGIMVLDENGIILEANKEVANDSLYSSDELIGSYVGILVPEENSAQVSTNIHRILSGENLTIEVDNRRKDGTLHPVILRETAIKLPGGKPGILTVSNDISQSKEMENSLKQSEEKYRKLVNEINDGFFTSDNKGFFTFSNKAMANILGFDSAEEVIGHNIFEFLPVDAVSEWQNKFNESLVTGVAYDNLVVEIKKRDGQPAIVESRDSLIIENNQIVGTRGVIRDITERRKTELALRESEAQFRNLLIDMQSLAVQGYTQDGTTIYWNKSSERVYGYSAEEAMGKNLLDLIIPPEMRELVSEAIKEMIKTGQPIPPAELSLMRKDGSHVPFFSSHHVVKVPGQPSELFCVDFDLTDSIARKKAEEELSIRNSELQKLNATKDKFFSIIAHDLKSPFNSILGFSEILVEQVKDKDYNGIEKYAGIIQQSSNRAMDLLLNLLEWTRSQTRRIEFNPEYFELVAFIEDIIPVYDDVSTQKSIKILRSLPHNIPVYADKQMIGTVMRNLINNAIKFTRNGGEVTLSAQRNDNEVTVLVKDNGVGIPKKRLNKLFRIDESESTKGTANEHGTGLGLILCKEFVEKHGGNIWVESEEGRGSTFYFSLPFNPFLQEQENAVQQPAINNPRDETRKLKTLIVEDDEISEMLLIKTIDKFSSEIIKTKSGVKAIEIVKENPDIDLILMDIRLPMMDGYEATRQIRQFNKNVIIIAQTAYGLAGDREKAIEAGCNDYITKPINFAGLNSLLKKYFEK